MMGGSRCYAVEMPRAALERVPSDKVPPICAQMQRMAQEMAAGSAHGGQVRTMQIDGDYSALVFIDHDARHITLLEVIQGPLDPEQG